MWFPVISKQEKELKRDYHINATNLIMQKITKGLFTIIIDTYNTAMHQNINNKAIFRVICADLIPHNKVILNREQGL